MVTCWYKHVTSATHNTDINQFIYGYIFRFYEPSSGFMSTLIQEKLYNCFRKKTFFYIKKVLQIL